MTDLKADMAAFRIEFRAALRRFENSVTAQLGGIETQLEAFQTSIRRRCIALMALNISVAAASVLA